MAKDSVTPNGIPGLADHLFRHEAGKLVSYLTGLFGLEHLQLAEDVVQDAMVRAMQTWPYYGVPDNPAAWLTQAAKNLALDRLRREKRFREKEEAIATTFELRRNTAPDSATNDESGLGDDRLRLMFACCHPAIPLEAQAALALRTLCGFSPGEIASTFLTTEVAVEKRLTRARQRIRELALAFEIPTGPALEERLAGVLQTIYLLFNEGYKASTGERLTRDDLCHESIRLLTLLVQHPVGDRPEVHALLALFYLNTSRLPARTSREGEIVRLSEQDRGKWDREMISRGMQHLAQSAEGEPTVYHLQAGIAAYHATAPDEESTNWVAILDLYDALVAMDDSPIIALNRAVALARVEGPAKGIEALSALEKGGRLDGYHLYHAVRAELEVAQQNRGEASRHLRRALELAALPAEQAFLSRRLRDLD
jgi:RNA polymerase sigma factor (sigma-70 family)